MDWRSHRLFGGMLLEKIGKDINYDSWSLAPDIDIGPLHRWHRHRFSVLNEICTDGMNICQPKSEEVFADQMGAGEQDSKTLESDIDKDAVTLCITSHFYLDMFSGYIAPFGILYPIFPNKAITRNILKNESSSKTLIRELRNLPITDEFSIKFYGASRTIMSELVSDMSTFNLEEIVSVLVYRMSTYAQMDRRDKLYRKAINNICNFTGNERYDQHGARSWKDGFDKFEQKYAKLINKFTEFL